MMTLGYVNRFCAHLQSQPCEARHCVALDFLRNISVRFFLRDTLYL